MIFLREKMLSYAAVLGTWLGRASFLSDVERVCSEGFKSLWDLE